MPSLLSCMELNKIIPAGILRDCDMYITQLSHSTWEGPDFAISPRTQLHTWNIADRGDCTPPHARCSFPRQASPPRDVKSEAENPVVQPISPVMTISNLFPRLKAKARRSLLPYFIGKRPTSLSFELRKELEKCHWTDGGELLISYPLYLSPSTHNGARD